MNLSFQRKSKNYYKEFMNKIIREILTASDEKELSRLLSEYQSSRLEFKSIGQCRSEYNAIIDLINQEHEHYDTALKNGEETIDFWLVQSIKISDALKNLEFAKRFFSNGLKGCQKPIVVEEMPDFLTDEQLSEYFGWELSTIYSKRSRGELPRVNGFQLTPKDELLKLIKGNIVEAKEKPNSQDAINAKINSFFK